MQFIFVSTMRIDQVLRGGGAYWAFVCQLDDWGLWKWGVKQTILHRCPQGFSVPNRFNKNKSLLPSESSRSLWFTSPLDDTSLNVIGQLKVMKCYAVLWGCGRGPHTAPLCDRQQSLNVKENFHHLAPAFFLPLFDSLLPIRFLPVNLCGAIKQVFDCPQMSLLGFEWSFPPVGASPSASDLKITPTMQKQRG